MKATNESSRSSRRAHLRLAPAGQPYSAPKTFDDLSFTTRDAKGRMVWWSVTPPSTQFWPAHFDLGRALARELLELMREHDPEPGEGRAVGFILAAVAKWMPTVAGTAAAGIADGFFSVIGEAAAGAGPALQTAGHS